MYMVNAIYLLIKVIVNFYDRHWGKVTGSLLIISGIVPMILERDCTVAAVAWMIGIPILFSKEEE